jgi:hypothetical protein
MQEPIYNYFFQQGILGVLVIINMIVIGVLWKKYEKARDNFQSMLIEHAKQVKILQEEKIQMQRDHLNSILQVKDEVTEVTNKITNTMETLVTALTAKHE